MQVDSLSAELPGKPKNTGVGSLSLLQGIQSCFQIITVLAKTFKRPHPLSLHLRTLDHFFLSPQPCSHLAGESSGSQEDQLCTALVNQLNKFADKETLVQFLRCFLLESNSSSVRWQAHCLTLHIYRWAWGLASAGRVGLGQSAWCASVLSPWRAPAVPCQHLHQSESS